MTTGISNGRTMQRVAVIGVVALAIGLSACGRRGPLLPPPSPYASTPGGVAGGQVQQQHAPADKSNSPFFLDFLL